MDYLPFVLYHLHVVAIYSVIILLKRDSFVSEDLID